jgi:hypothetical protein
MAAVIGYIISGDIQLNTLNDYTSVVGLTSGVDSQPYLTSSLVGQDVQAKVQDTLFLGDGEIIVELYYTEVDLPTI